MPKQLYIPLPCAAARRQLIDRQVGPGGPVRAELSEQDVQKIVDKTAGYSGSDMKSVVQEACQGPVHEAVMQHGAMGATLIAVVCSVAHETCSLWLVGACCTAGKLHAGCARNRQMQLALPRYVYRGQPCAAA